LLAEKKGMVSRAKEAMSALRDEGPQSIGLSSHSKRVWLAFSLPGNIIGRYKIY
jgi:hypothetical protein